MAITRSKTSNTSRKRETHSNHAATAPGANKRKKSQEEWSRFDQERAAQFGAWLEKLEQFDNETDTPVQSDTNNARSVVDAQEVPITSPRNNQESPSRVSLKGNPYAGSASTNSVYDVTATQDPITENGARGVSAELGTQQVDAPLNTFAFSAKYYSVPNDVIAGLTKYRQQRDYFKERVEELEKEKYELQKENFVMYMILEEEGGKTLPWEGGAQWRAFLANIDLHKIQE